MTHITTEMMIDAVRRTANVYLTNGVRLKQRGHDVLAAEAYEDAEKLFELIEHKNADIIEMLAGKLHQVMEEKNGHLEANA